MSKYLMYTFKHLAKKPPQNKPPNQTTCILPSPSKPNEPQPPRENKHQTSYPETQFGPAVPLGIWKFELNLPNI